MGVSIFGECEKENRSTFVGLKYTGPVVANLFSLVLSERTGVVMQA